MLRVAVVGASGYTGAELVRLLQFHPKVDLTGVFGFRTAGKSISDVFPQFKGAIPLTLEAFSAAKIQACYRSRFYRVTPRSQRVESGRACRSRAEDYRPVRRFPIGPGRLRRMVRTGEAPSCEGST